MARHNRLSLPGSNYEIKTDTVNGENLFMESGIKDKIVAWMQGIAAFSGVKVFAWSVLDNQLRLVVNVPDVPAQYRSDKLVTPSSYAFGMRPTEKRIPLYLPKDINPGDEFPTPPRPDLGFMLSDEEMLVRLTFLYGKSKADEKRDLWLALRKGGFGEIVDKEKACYCRRMYNISQFMKSLTERIAMFVNATRSHGGPVFARRFTSRLLEDAPEILQSAILNVNLESYRRNPSSRGRLYEWSSIAAASLGNNSISHLFNAPPCNHNSTTRHSLEVSEQAESTFNSTPSETSAETANLIETRNDNLSSVGSYSADDERLRILSPVEICRTAMSEIWGMTWEDACNALRSKIDEQLPDDIHDSILEGRIKPTLSLLVQMGIPEYEQSHHLGRSKSFVDFVKSSLPQKFPGPSFRPFYRLLTFLQPKGSNGDSPRRRKRVVGDSPLLPLIA